MLGRQRPDDDRTTMSVQQPDPYGATAEPAGPETDDDLLLEEPDEAAAAGPGLLVRCGAELFGTFFLVFAGVGVMLYSQFTTGVGGNLAVALAFGIAALAGGFTVGRVSGGHFNPAISFGAAIAGRLSWADLLPYWLAQIVGGALATAVLFLTIPDQLETVFGRFDDKRELLGTTANGYGEHSPFAHLLASSNITSDVTFPLAAALLVEVVATGIFVAVVLAVTRRPEDAGHAPFVVGLTLAVGLLVAAPITNGSLNPARSTATAILGPTWALQQLWLFWVAPLLGAAIAGLLYRAFAPSSAEPVDDEADDEGDDGGEDYEEVDVLPTGPTGVA
jgi:aquaporin Z